MATKKFFAWLDSRSFWHLMKSRGKNKKIPSYFVQPFFREANEVHHEWLKGKIMRRNQWKNFHLHLNCQCRVYWHIDISVIVWILQSIFYLQIFLWYTRLYDPFADNWKYTLNKFHVLLPGQISIAPHQEKVCVWTADTQKSDIITLYF